MLFNKYSICVLIIIAIAVFGCDKPEIIKDLQGQSFTLVNQDSTQMHFPYDFRHYNTLVGFIYTHCPDVCPIITAKMKKISIKLEDHDDLRFVGITFDPSRDTPSVLSKYMNTYDLKSPRFNFLTGDSTTVDSLLKMMGIVAKVAEDSTTKYPDDIYFINHTNRITLIDKRGRIRGEYSGSYEPAEHIIEDIQKIK